MRDAPWLLILELWFDNIINAKQNEGFDINFEAITTPVYIKYIIYSLPYHQCLFSSPSQIYRSKYTLNIALSHNDVIKTC